MVHEAHAHAPVLGREDISRERGHGQVLVAHRREKALHQRLQLVQRVAAQNNQVQQVAAIVFSVKRDNFLTRDAAQRLLVARAKLGERVFGSRDCAPQLHAAPQVRLQVLVVLRVDCVQLPVHHPG